MKIREHKGSYDESMLTAREVADLEELLDVIRGSLSHCGVNVTPERLHVKPYTDAWRIITVDGYGCGAMRVTRSETRGRGGGSLEAPPNIK